MGLVEHFILSARIYISTQIGLNLEEISILDADDSKKLVQNCADELGMDKKFLNLMYYYVLALSVEDKGFGRCH